MISNTETLFLHQTQQHQDDSPIQSINAEAGSGIQALHLCVGFPSAVGSSTHQTLESISFLDAACTVVSSQKTEPAPGSSVDEI